MNADGFRRLAQFSTPTPHRTTSAIPAALLLFCAVSTRANTLLAADTEPQIVSNRCVLFGPCYGQHDYWSPVLVYLAREQRRPVYQHLALWDQSHGPDPMRWSRECRNRRAAGRTAATVTSCHSSRNRSRPELVVRRQAATRRESTLVARWDDAHVDSRSNRRHRSAGVSGNESAFRRNETRRSHPFVYPVVTARPDQGVLEITVTNLQSARP